MLTMFDGSGAPAAADPRHVLVRAVERLVRLGLTPFGRRGGIARARNTRIATASSVLHSVRTAGAWLRRAGAGS